MSIAAVPNYLQDQDFTSASPGMRFGMYLRLWGINQRTHDLLWKTHDIGYEVRGPNRQEREVKYENKVSALKAATRLSASEKQLMESLLKRQAEAFGAAAANHSKICLPALATAPFTTGLGNEHPLENGFAFLNPYGLPYLPGSGVKGVLRQAARELASGDWGDSPWREFNRSLSGVEANAADFDSAQSATYLDALFGREDSNEALRGALSFWDVIPQIKGDSLMVEIMTPHQSHYYQQNPAAGSISPHDSGQPIPISYLTVPPGSGFTFHVVCDLAHLERIAPDLARDGAWKTLLTAAFEHAFAWCGFGAKTAVGYGAMQEDPAVAAARAERLEKERAELEQQANAARLEAMSPEDRAWEDHQPGIAEFQTVFDAAKAKPYQPGSAFDQERLSFMAKALSWADARSRHAAADLLNSTLTKAWGTPGKKETRQRLKDAIAQLAGRPD